jgi:hypothetical protein
MSTVTAYLKRAPRTLMFWLVVAVFAAAAIRVAYPNEPFDEVRTGEQPLEVAGTADGVWVLNYADHSVSLINPTSKEEVFEKVVGDDVAPALSANADGAWLILEGGRTIARIDADSQDIADRFDLTDVVDDGAVAQDLAAGEGFVWVTTGEGGQMIRLDTETGEFDDPIDLDQSVVQPQIVGDALWVYQSDGLTEYDNTTGEQLRQLDTAASRVHDFFATEDSVYLIVNTDNVAEEGFLVRMDPDNDEQSSESAPRVRLQKSTPTHLTAIGEQVFVSGTGGILQEVESLENESHLTLVASEQVTVSTKDLRTVIVLDDTIWIADGTNGVVHQPISGIEGEVVTDDTTP